jgi:2-keto-4-pentenoate hydratase/2-oxohepta-3-ene-1,7-dioic acid hydratase in catechol pathway
VRIERNSRICAHLKSREGMKLARFHDGSSTRIGLVEGDEIVDLRTGDSRLPNDLVSLLRAAEDGLQAVRYAARFARRRPLSSVRLLQPIAAPRKFLGLGLSFRSHIEEVRSNGGAIPDHQVWFNKQVTALNGPFDPIHLPKASPQLDYEGELAIVIGTRARHVSRRDAKSIIAGYMVCNDLTVRDWQRRSPTATLGKSFDTHGPVGPWLTTADEVSHPENLRIRTWVNGDLRQDGNTNELIYSFGEMIEELTTAFTLEPGDILTTGTPSGIGATANPPRFLTEGEVVRVEVESLGYIENKVIAEPC